MLHAQLHGKLSRDQENLEDILTSNVFGALSYAAPGAGLIPFLRCVEGADAAPLRALLSSSTINRAEYTFWPWTEQPGCRGCEPDVRLDLYSGDELEAVIFVESKYRSEKSSEADATDGVLPPRDQLAREWDNLVRISGNIPAFLLYVTAHYREPAEDIAASQHDLEQRRGARGAIAWLPWRAFSQLHFSTDQRLLLDVQRLLRDRYELRYFSGVRVEKLRAPWSFVGSPPASHVIRFDWPMPPQPTWRFQK